jgi:hypothetical protein
MRLLVVCDDPVVPVNSGGRQVMHMEIQVLRELGEVHGIAYHHASEDFDYRGHEQLFETVMPLPRKGFVGELLRHPRLPYQVSSRRIDRRALVQLQKTVKQVDVVVAHHEWCLPTARLAASVLGDAKVVLRSHNNERQYYESLVRTSRGVRWLYLLLEAKRMTEKVIRALVGEADEVWLISPRDRGAYETADQCVNLSPILIDDRSAPRVDAPPACSRIGFIGALDVPIAVQGLEWFVEEVWPLVRRVVPDAEFAVAGRRASERLQQYLAEQGAVTFFGWVADALDYVAGCRVLINPVFSGSGINVKVGMAAQGGRPFVTTSFGVRGLGDLAGAEVADTAEDFALRCQRLLLSDAAWAYAAAVMRTRSRRYGFDASLTTHRERLAALTGR